MAETALPPIRRTRQRQAVEEALGRDNQFSSAQDLHLSIRSAGGTISLATVYNQLRQMAERHEVDVVRTEAGEALYRRCGAGSHHHHLRCRTCGKVQELEAPAVEIWASRIGQQSGFTQLVHTLEVIGVCPSCSHA
jgi:Fur family ferric uptake transcriptional regulator